MKTQYLREILYRWVWGLFLISSNISYADNLSLSIYGSIESKCEIIFSGGNQVDLSGVKEKTLPLDVYCNQAMSMAISSKNGGLKLQQKENFPAIEYLFSLNIEKASFTAVATSKDLMAGHSFNSSGVIPFAASGQIKITLKENLLYAGSYTDIIAIDVFPSLHNVSQ